MQVTSPVVETKLLISAESKSFIAFGSKWHCCSWEGLQAPSFSHFKRTPQINVDIDFLESPVQNSDFRCYGAFHVPPLAFADNKIRNAW